MIIIDSRGQRWGVWTKKGTCMNEKFFDLKKEKQDRMINAALKVFANNGYAHASTDEIVKEAGISKGLLFHYFTNKISLYSFIYEYSARYICLEMTSMVDRTDNDYFSIYLNIRNAEAQVMRSYPYMILFLRSTENENVIEAMNELYDKKDIVPNKIQEFFDHANTSHIKTGVDTHMLDEMIKFTSDAVLLKTLRENEDRPEKYYDEVKQYILTLKNIANK